MVGMKRLMIFRRGLTPGMKAPMPGVRALMVLVKGLMTLPQTRVIVMRGLVMDVSSAVLTVSSGPQLAGRCGARRRPCLPLLACNFLCLYRFPKRYQCVPKCSGNALSRQSVCQTMCLKWTVSVLV